MAGPADILRKVNDLKVVCRKSNCVWIGKMGAYAAHSCPSPVSDGHEVGLLQFLLMFDERNEVKIAAIETIAGKVLNARRTTVNEIYLGMLYEYSIRLNDVLEVQNVCLDVLVEAITMTHGVQLVEGICEGVTERMCELSTIPCLESRARMVLQYVDPDHVPGETSESALGFLVSPRVDAEGPW